MHFLPQLQVDPNSTSQLISYYPKSIHRPFPFIPNQSIFLNEFYPFREFRVKVNFFKNLFRF